MPPAERRKEFTLPSGATILGFNAPQFIDPDAPQDPANFRIDANVLIPEGGAEGTIVSYGSKFFGGFLMYAKDDRLVYEQAFPSGHRVLVSRQPITPGEGTWSLEMQPAPGVTDQVLVRLWINDQRAGEAIVPNLGTVTLGYLGVGEVFGTAPSDAFVSPFKFIGTIKEVRIRLR